MVIKPRFFLKAPIEGVQFSNQEVGLDLEFETEDGDWTTVEAEMSKQMRVVVQKYFTQLQGELSDGQSKVIEKLQVELAKTYEEKLKKASEEIYKLRDILKDNGIQYN